MILQNLCVECIMIVKLHYDSKTVFQFQFSKWVVQWFLAKNVILRDSPTRLTTEFHYLFVPYLPLIGKLQSLGNLLK